MALIDRQTCATKQSVGKKMKEMIWRENIKVKRKEKENNGVTFLSFFSNFTF